MWPTHNHPIFRVPNLNISYFSFFGIFDDQISYTITGITNEFGEPPLLPNDGVDVSRKEGLQSTADIVQHISFASIPIVEIGSYCDRFYFSSNYFYLIDF